jgi:hypothetical protein
MKTRKLVVAAALGALAIAGPAAAQTCTDLIAGQQYVAGTVCGQEANGTLYVTYSTNADWVMTETHMATGMALADVPQTRAGNPKNGAFPFAGTYKPGVGTVTYTVPLGDVQLFCDASGTVLVAAHAVVQPTGGGKGLSAQTAWAAGPGFAGKNWSTYFWVTLDSCNRPG